MAAPAVSKIKGASSKQSVPGFETWIATPKITAGTYKVTHCGILRYMAQLKDADGNNVCYASAGLKQIGGKWYINLVTHEGVDTTGYTVETSKGNESYLATLGIAGVTLNDVVVVDPAAAAAATATPAK